MWKTQVRSLGWEHFLEKGTAIHSSILALENPHGQRSLEGNSEVRQDGATNTFFLLSVCAKHVLSLLCYSLHHI